MSGTVILVDDDNRRAAPLVRYLEEVGFSVRHVAAQEPDNSDGDAIVWMVGSQFDDQMINDTVYRWLSVRDARAIVVCDRSAELHRLIADARIWCLPAPIYGWQIVKALREASSKFCPRSRPVLHRRRRRRART